MALRGSAVLSPSSSCCSLMQDTPSLQDLKLMYYNLLIRYHEHHNSYIDICRCYRSIYEVGAPCPHQSPVWAAAAFR